MKIAARTEEPTTTYKEQHVDGDDEDDDLFPLDRCRFNPRIAHSPVVCWLGNNPLRGSSLFSHTEESARCLNVGGWRTNIKDPRPVLAFIIMRDFRERCWGS